MELQYHLSKDRIIPNKLETLQLEILCSSFTIQNLRFDVQADSAIQIIGASQFQVERVEQGKSARVELSLRVSRMGSAAIWLRRIRGRVGGDGKAFADVQLEIKMLEQAVAFQPPSFIPTTRQVPLGQIAHFHFELQNLELCAFETILVELLCGSVALEVTELDRLEAGQLKAFSIPILLAETGEHELKLHLFWKVQGQQYECVYSAWVLVKPAPDASSSIQQIEIGTLIQNVHKTTDIIHIQRGGKTQVHSVNSEQAGGYLSTPEHIACPHCGEFTKDGNFCNSCGGNLKSD